jgi:microcystin-dependent protein
MSKGIVSNRGGLQVVAGGATVLQSEATGQTGATITFAQTYTFGASGVLLYRNGVLMDKVGAFSGGIGNAEEYQEVNNGVSSTQITLNITDPAIITDLFQLVFMEGTATVGTSGSGVGDTDTLFVDNADDDDIADFVIDGFTISQLDPVNGTDVWLGTHDAALEKFMERTFVVPPKFRGKNLTLIIDANSDAAAGNLLVNVEDLTNIATLLNGGQITVVSDINASVKSSFTFDCPATCQSMSYKIRAVAESGKFSRVDDITLKLTKRAATEVLEFDKDENVFSARIANNGTASIVSQNSSFIQSVTRTALGFVQVDFIPGFFSEAPAIVSVAGPGLAQIPTVTAISATSATISNHNYQGSAVDQTIDIVLQRQGADYKQGTLTRIIEQESFQDILVEEADSYIELSPATGASGSQTLTFGGIVRSGGEAISYNQSTGELTALKAGIYHAHVSDEPLSDAAEMSVRVNGVPKVLDAIGVTPNTRNTVSWSGHLEVGDVVTFHNTNTRGSAGARSGYLVHQGSLQKLQTNPDAKIGLNISEMRLLGATSRSSGANAAVVVFNSINSVRGSGITVDSSDGTFITFEKDGIATITTSLEVPGVSDMAIWRNPTVTTGGVTAGDKTAQTVTATTANTNWNEAMTWSGAVRAGDTFCIANDNVPTDTGRNSLYVVHQEDQISVAVSNVVPQYEDAESQVRVQNSGSGAAGYGSTGTAIRRFTNIHENTGNAIDYIDSAVDGASFVIREDGYYGMSLSHVREAAGGETYGISLNSYQTNIRVLDIDPITRLAHTTVDTTGFDSSCSWQGHLKAGDIIRVHGPVAESITVRNSRCHFTISKVKMPSITNVDVSSFIDANISDGPVGELVALPSIYAPDNFLYCNGRAVSRSLYSDLFAIIGTTFGAGDGSNTFNLPDLRSEFLRGQDDGRGIDTGRALGSSQEDAFESHIHTMSATHTDTGDGAGYGLINSNIFPISGTTPHGFATPAGAVETRPRNVAVRYYIRYQSVAARLYNIAAEENIFSATIEGSQNVLVGQEQVILYKSADFIKRSVHTAGTGKWDIEFVPGFFSEPPIVTGTTVGDYTNSTSITVNYVGTDKVTVESNGTAGAFDSDFSIVCHRQGADYKDLERRVVQLTDFVRVNRTLTQELIHRDNSNTLLDASAEIRFNPALISSNGSSILVAEDDPTNSRTKFVAQKDCRISVNWTAINSGAGYSEIYKNDAQMIRGTDAYTATASSHVSGSFSLRAGDFISLGINSSAAAGGTADFTILAEAQDLERVGNVDQHENIFSGRISNNGTAAIVSQHSSFIDSVNRGALGTVTVTFTPGFFTVAPSITAVPDGLASNNTVAVGSVSTTSATFETNTTTGSKVDIDFSIHASRQDSDYKSIQDIVVALPKIQVMNIGPATGFSSIGSTTIYKIQAINYTTGDIFGSILGNQLSLGAGEYLVDIPFRFYGDCDNSSAGLYNVNTSLYIYDQFITSNPGAVPHKSTGIMKHKFTLDIPTLLEFHTKVANPAGVFESIMGGTISKLN